MNRQPPVAPDLTSLTGFWLRRAYALAVDCARTGLGSDANIRDVGILMMLDERGPISQGALADLLRINRTIMVKLIDALHRQGYVVRARNPADRRAYALSVSEAGRQRCKELLTDLDQVEAALTSDLDDDQKALLNELLRSIVSESALTLLPSLHDRLGYLLAVAYREVVDRATSRLTQVGFEPRHFGVLAVVDRDGPCTQQHVATVLGVSAPAVLPLIDDVEVDALISRKRGTTDRRTYDLTLTAKGRDRLAEALGLIESVHAEIVDVIGVEGDHDIRRLLRAVVDIERSHG